MLACCRQNAGPLKAGHATQISISPSRAPAKTQLVGGLCEAARERATFARRPHKGHQQVYLLGLELRQIWREPFLDELNALAFAACVFFDLVSLDLPYAEILRLGVGEIEAAYARSRVHREGFS